MSASCKALFVIAEQNVTKKIGIEQPVGQSIFNKLPKQCTRRQCIHASLVRIRLKVSGFDCRQWRSGGRCSPKFIASADQ
jgi:hypothetical protein